MLSVRVELKLWSDLAYKYYFGNGKWGVYEWTGMDALLHFDVWDDAMIRYL